MRSALKGGKQQEGGFRPVPLMDLSDDEYDSGDEVALITFLDSFHSDIQMEGVRALGQFIDHHPTKCSTTFSKMKKSVLKLLATTDSDLREATVILIAKICRNLPCNTNTEELMVEFAEPIAHILQNVPQSYSSAHILRECAGILEVVNTKSCGAKSST